MGAPRAARAASAVLLIALVLARGRAVGAGPEVPGLGTLAGSDGQVTIDAETIDYDQATNVITARGAVKIRRGEMVLTADLVRLDRASRVASAEGSVVLTDPQGTLSADALAIDLVDETGSIDDGAVFLNASRYQLTGRRFEKRVGQSYRIDDGSFTTCVCGPGEAPSWSVRGRQVTLDLDGYCWVRGGTFAIKDVPVFYLPVGVFPVRRERQTGLLFPRIGFSNRRGFQLAQPLYVDINRSMDATLTLDLETSARVGMLAEYRYALSRDTWGEVHGSYFNEQIRGASSDEVVNRAIADPDIPIDRWSAAVQHDQWLPGGARGFADVLRVSDDLFLREINVFTFNPGVDVALRTRRFERSRVGVARAFDRGLVMGTSTWYQDFINPDEFVFQTPPRLTALGSWHLWDDRAMVHVHGEGVNFERDSGFDGQRLDLWPEVEVPFRAGPYLFGSWRGGFRETVYHLDETSVPDPAEVNTNPADPGSPPPSILPALERDATREVFYLRGRVQTALSRVLPFDRFGIARLKHTIEPSVDYLYLPRTSVRQAELPLFDDVDRVNQRSVFTYGVTSRLLGRQADEVRSRRGGAIRELARLSLFQSYDLAGKGGDFVPQVDPDTGEVLRDEDRISDLSMYLRMTPAEFLRFEGQTDYSVTGDGTKGATVGLLLADPRQPEDDFRLASLRGRSQIGVGYRFVANNAVEDVNGSFLLRLSKRLYAAYETRYDVVSNRFLENRYGLRLISNCECWVIDVGVSDKRNPDEVEGRVLVSLVGLGEIGREPLRRSLGDLMPSGGGIIDE